MDRLGPEARGEDLPGIPPPVGALDRFHFSLPASPRGFVVVPKHFVDEVDPKRAPESVPEKPVLTTFAAKDEWRSVGFVVYATSALKQLTVTATSPTGPNGAAIPAENVGVFLSRRVMQRRAPRVRDDDRVPAAALLDPSGPFDLPTGHFKEVTVTVHVPADAAPGLYRGTVSVSAAGGSDMAVPLEVRVLPFRVKPSSRKEYGVYLHKFIDLAPEAREVLRAALRDIRAHGVTHLFCHLGIDYSEADGKIDASYDRLDEGLALLREFGFKGALIIQSRLLVLARLMGHKDVTGKHASGESLEGDETFAQQAERAIRGLAPIQKKYPEFELVVTHMDEVLGRGRLPRYIRLTRPVRRVPEQRVYITLHTLPRPNVPEMTRELDPYMDIRCYNGHALDLWLQAGHSFEELGKILKESGDEGWTYYNPHRPFFTSKWARIVNGLYLWWSPLHVHCPFRYRTMRTYPPSFTHNMGFGIQSPLDPKTVIATRQWEGFRLGVQDARYFCMLEDLVAQAGDRDTPEVQQAKEWLDHLRRLMPSVEDIQEIPDMRCKNYPVLYTVAARLDGQAFHDLRAKTADHIMALRKVLGVSD